MSPLRLLRGCPCGEGSVHEPEAHLWTPKDVAGPARRSADQVRKDVRRPGCPLTEEGLRRGSRGFVWSWPEVEAYLRWIVSRSS